MNVAGLLLTRSAQRSAEVALRGVLGASRMEIVRQMLVESLMLSLLGGLAGIALAVAILQGTIRFLPETLPRLNEVSLNGTVLAFAVGLSVLTGLLFGVLPAVRIRGWIRRWRCARGHGRLQAAVFNIGCRRGW